MFNKRYYDIILPKEDRVMSDDRKCPACSGTMVFDPGWNRLVCQFCGFKEEIPELVSKVSITEADLDPARNVASRNWGMEYQIVSCSLCGARTLNDKLQLSGRCPFCGSTTVVPVETNGDIIAPMGVIPFSISTKRATGIFREWIGNRSLAPEKLSRNANLNEFTGIYLPYFTFDADSITDFDGMFGYTAGEGLNWHKRAGQLSMFIDDFPVVASRKLLEDRLLVSAASYRTREAKPYTPSALAGFPAEQYSMGLAQAWDKAKCDVVGYLKDAIKKNESAYMQKNMQVSTVYANIKYKYLLVPMWINSFTYDNRLYTIVINGQTGEISGQWPKSFGMFMKKAAEIFFPFRS